MCVGWGVGGGGGGCTCVQTQFSYLPELCAVCKRDGGLPHGAAARLVVAVNAQIDRRTPNFTSLAQNINCRQFLQEEKMLCFSTEPALGDDPAKAKPEVGFKHRAKLIFLQVYSVFSGCRVGGSRTSRARKPLQDSHR